MVREFSGRFRILNRPQFKMHLPGLEHAPQPSQIETQMLYQRAQDNLEVQKVLDTSKKNPSKWPIMYFARIKK
jgi:hypothetical protein